MKSSCLSWAAVLFLSHTATVVAQGVLPTTSFFQFLRPSDPRSTALGLGGAAYSSGVLAPLTNPAGLAGSQEISAAFSHIPSHALFGGRYYRQNGFSAAVPVKGVVVGVHYLDIWSDPDVIAPGGEHDLTHRQIVLAAAKKLGSLAVGVGARRVDDHLDYAKADGWFFDIGLQYRMNLGSGETYFLMGSSLSNMGKPITYRKDTTTYGSDEIPRLWRVAVAIGAPVVPDVSLMITTEYQKIVNHTTLYRWDHIAGGLEIVFLDHLAARTGYQFELRNRITSQRDYHGWTYGLGMTTPDDLFQTLPVQFELAYAHGIRIGVSDPNIVSIILKYRLDQP